MTKAMHKEIAFDFYAPLAKKVHVAGCFSDWAKKPISLKATKEGHWSKKVKLKPGRHEYRFLIDGNWENDQKDVEIAVNEFGETNCVITVQ